MIYENIWTSARRLAAIGLMAIVPLMYNNAGVERYSAPKAGGAVSIQEMKDLEFKVLQEQYRKKLDSEMTSEYTVVKKDNYTRIAHRKHISVALLRKLNSDKSFPKIKVGEHLKIPSNNFDAKKYLEYDPHDTARNWSKAYESSGLDISLDSKILGTRTFARLLGIRPGYFASGEKSIGLLCDNSEYFKKAERKYTIDALLAMSVVKTESGGDRQSISKTGSKGIAGLTDYIYNSRNRWSDGAVRPAINPFHNDEAIDRAVDNIRTLQDKYHSRILALTAYNQGEWVVDKAIKAAKRQGVKGVMNIVRVKDSKGRYLIKTEGRTYYARVMKNRRDLQKSPLIASSLESHDAPLLAAK